MKRLVAFTLVLLSTLSFAQEYTTMKTACIQQSEYTGKTLDEQKQVLIDQAKQLALTDLYGEMMFSKTDMLNGKIKTDEIRSRAVGAVRLKGNPSFYNGKNFGEVCTDVTAYVTDKDIEKFSPKEVILEKYCFNDRSVAMKDIKTQAKYGAYKEIISQYKPSLKLSGEQAEKLIHGFKISNDDFDFDTASYCFNAVATILPYELEMGVDSGPIGTQEKEVKEQSHNVDNSERWLGMYMGNDNTTTVELKLEEGNKFSFRFYRADEFEGEFYGTYIKNHSAINFIPNSNKIDKYIKGKNYERWRSVGGHLQYIDANSLRGKLNGAYSNRDIALKKVKILPSENYNYETDESTSKWFGMYICSKNYSNIEIVLKKDQSAEQRVGNYFWNYEGKNFGSYVLNNDTFMFQPSNSKLDVVYQGKQRASISMVGKKISNTELEGKVIPSTGSCPKGKFYVRRVNSLPSEDVIK